MIPTKIWVWTSAIVTLGSGLINLVSVMSPAIPGRFHTLENFFPLEFIHLSRSAVLLLGFALLVTSLNILKRKQRAYRLVNLMAILSIGFHLGKGLDYEAAVFS